MSQYKLGVIGNPIAYSLSPRVFSLFAKQFNLDLTYDKILAKDNHEFAQIIQTFFAQGGYALNVTSPFKQEAYKVADIVTSRSKFCMAANFLRLNQSSSGKANIVADTTDGIGLVEGITNNLQFSLANKNILILGSGFVLDSVLLDLIIQNPFRLDVLARNQQKLDALCDKYHVGKYDSSIRYDLIINTVPNNVENQLLNQLTQPHDSVIAYDMSYVENSKFLNHMKDLNQSIKLHNGLGMLIEQAKVAFVKLFNLSPNTQVVFDQIIKES